MSPVPSLIPVAFSSVLAALNSGPAELKITTSQTWDGQIQISSPKEEGFHIQEGYGRWVAQKPGFCGSHRRIRPNWIFMAGQLGTRMNVEPEERLFAGAEVVETSSDLLDE